MKIYKTVTATLNCEVTDRYLHTGNTRIGNDETYNKDGDQISRAGTYLLYSYVGSVYYQPDTMLSGEFVSKKVAAEISVGKGPIHAYKKEISRLREIKLKLSICIENEVQEWEVHRYLGNGWSQAEPGHPVIDAARAFTLGIKFLTNQ